MNSRLVTALAISGALVTGVAACGDDTSKSSSGSSSTPSGGSKLSGSIAGAGSSAQAAAQEAWRAGFQQANSGVTVASDPVGSGGGREQFNAKGTVFGGTDSAFKDDELTAAQKRCGGPDKFIEAPVYVSPIAVIYNLAGVDSLQLKPATIAAIFSGKVTKWDDAMIKADNPDAKLPSTRVTVVHRSDDSGTTNNFTDYLSKASDGGWKDEPADTWPIKGQEAAEGTSGVVDAVQNGKGTIGYADASQAGQLGIAKVGVNDEFLAPSAESAAKIFGESKETDDPGKYVFTYALNRQPKESDVYPIVLASYEMACTTYDKPADAANVKAYLQYISSADGQEVAAKNAGSAPIPDAVRTKITGAVDAMGGGQ